MSSFKKLILFSILPALIAGIFAIAPKLYDEFTEKKAILNYKIIKGPILSEGEIKKAIYAIHISNAGKKPLTNITSLLKTNNNIEAITAYENTGMNPVINKNNKPYIVTVETLHPNESFSISLMITSVNSDPSLSVNLRSKETLGSAEVSKDTGAFRSLDILGSITAALSVFLMSVLFLFRNKRSGSFIPVSLLSDRPNIIFYISARLGFKDIIKQHGIDEGEVTYLRYSDMLLAKGEAGEGDEKDKTILALKSLLLIEEMAKESKEIVIRNIRVLEGSNFSEENIKLISDKAIKAKNHSQLRELIDDYIANPNEFLDSKV